MKTFWITLSTFLIKNWKTTLGAVIMAILTTLAANNILQADLFSILTGILVSLGLVVSKDADKTGRGSDQLVK